MIEVRVVDQEGSQIETLQINEEVFGKRVAMPALKQVVQAYEARRRAGTASARGRGEVSGSTRKLFPQKHTGRARAGDAKAPHRRGGGAAFGPRPRSYALRLPRKLRRLALRSAYLSKILDRQMVVIDKLEMDAPKTKQIASLLHALKVQSSCLIGIKAPQTDVWKSARNLQRVDVKPVCDINAYDLLLRRHLLITKDALLALIDQLAGGADTLEDATA